MKGVRLKILGFRAEDLGFRIQGLQLTVYNLWGAECDVWGLPGRFKPVPTPSSSTSPDARASNDRRKASRPWSRKR